MVGTDPGEAQHDGYPRGIAHQSATCSEFSEILIVHRGYPRFARECFLEIIMTRLVAATAAVFMLMLGCAHAASLLSEQQARVKAINILKGDPYGKTPDEVSKNIKQIQFSLDGNTKACGAKKTPAWEFHVVVVTADKDQFNNGVIDGFLAVDARTGKILCANLPLLN